MNDELFKYTVAALKYEFTLRGLQTTVRKADLVQRLVDYKMGRVCDVSAIDLSAMESNANVASTSSCLLESQYAPNAD